YWVDLRALNDSAQITSTQTVNFQAYINGNTRNDGLYSAPALTTSSSLTPLAYSKSLNKKSVMVSDIETKRLQLVLAISTPRSLTTARPIGSMLGPSLIRLPVNRLI
ncbi:SH3-like domain-containing protein, partial [Oenococcus oeni]|uniref:SH3-like domain-containing protein n=1 Tax=Oenococcus oeni TaxID=1247 RepID=UPI000AC1C855